VLNSFDALAALLHHIMVLWMRTLARRSQKDCAGRAGPDQQARGPVALKATPPSRVAKPACAVNIQGRSRVRERRTSGSVRG
jgi:hypothetical protein